MFTQMQIDVDIFLDIYAFHSGYNVIQFTSRYRRLWSVVIAHILNGNDIEKKKSKYAHSNANRHTSSISMHSIEATMWFNSLHPNKEQMNIFLWWCRWKSGDMADIKRGDFRDNKKRKTRTCQWKVPSCQTNIMAPITEINYWNPYNGEYHFGQNPSCRLN